MKISKYLWALIAVITVFVMLFTISGKTGIDSAGEEPKTDLTFADKPESPGQAAAVPDEMNRPDSSLIKWIIQLKGRGLLLEDPILSDLKKNPSGYQEKRRAISLRYPELLNEIAAQRNRLTALYSGPDSSEQDSIIHSAELTLNFIIEKLITPLWMGGEWDMNGVPRNYPDLSKPVACGHFVQKILTDAGFNVQKNQGTWLAYLSPRDLIQSLSGSEPELYTSWEELKDELDRNGPGLYVFGLECGWGHVLFGRYDEDRLLFIHSGPHPVGASVHYDDGTSYITEFCGDRIWFAKLDRRLAEKWLLQQPIKPWRVMG